MSVMNLEPMRRDPALNNTLRRFTGYLLRRAYVAAVDAAKQTIPPPHRMRELLILLVLRDRGPLSQQELAALLQVNRTIMVGLVDSLEERGLARRERNPADRRSYALVPTELGRKTLRTLEPDVQKADAILTANLTAAERRRLHTALLQQLPEIDIARAGPLVAYTGYLLKQAHYARRDSASQALTKVGLEPRQFGVLSTLGDLQPCSQQELAGGIGVTPPVVLQLVEDLERSGLVRRERNRSDRRLYDLTLTAAGTRRLDAAAQIVDELHADEDEELSDLLVKLLGG